MLLSLLLTLQSTVNHFVSGNRGCGEQGKRGISGINAELLKVGGNAVLMSVHGVLCSAWKLGILPTDWKRGLVVPIGKEKGDCQDCNSY